MENLCVLRNFEEYILYNKPTVKIRVENWSQWSEIRMLLTPALSCHEDTAHTIYSYILLWHSPWRQHSKVQTMRAQHLDQ